MVMRSWTTTVIRLSLKWVRAWVAPRPVCSLSRRTTRLLMASQWGPVVAGSNLALDKPAPFSPPSVAESLERRKETERSAERLAWPRAPGPYTLSVLGIGQPDAPRLARRRA